MNDKPHNQPKDAGAPANPALAPAPLELDQTVPRASTHAPISSTTSRPVPPGKGENIEIAATLPVRPARPVPAAAKTDPAPAPVSREFTPPDSVAATLRDPATDDSARTIPPGLTAGRQVGGGRFTLIRQLGRGGMGVVWLARDQGLKEDAALKFLPPEVTADEMAINDLRAETQKSRRLSHPHILRIHDLHTIPGEPAFISMEFVNGSNLTALRLQQASPCFAWAFLQPVVIELCAALEYAHGKKLIHRDLKPANLMLDAKEGLKLADFGIAATASDSMSRVSVHHDTSGTIVYMSPQQMLGKQPRATDDIYALGATLYELLTSRPPFYLGNVAYQVQHSPPAPLADRLAQLELENDIPPAVNHLILACLAKEPGDRPQSAAAIIERLNILATAPPPRAPVAPPAVERPAPRAATETPPSPPVEIPGVPTAVTAMVTRAPASTPAATPSPRTPAPPPRVVSKLPESAPRPAPAGDWAGLILYRLVMAVRALKKHHPVFRLGLSGSGLIVIAVSALAAEWLCLRHPAGAGDVHSGPASEAGLIVQTRPANNALPGAVDFNRGLGYFEGRGVTQNYSEALNCFHKAAEAGSSDAEVYIGLMSHYGYGAARSDPEALAWFQKAAAAGNSDGLLDVGAAYEQGWGVKKDSRAALDWFRRAAKAGNAVAEYNLGCLLLRGGDGVPRDPGEAAKSYRTAAGAGIHDAEYNLGYMYETGEGLAKSANDAVWWLRQAADAGNSAAQYNLGYVYCQGEGVPQSAGDALKWFHKAAEAGNHRAERALGVMYEQGLGIPADKDQAIQWYRKAAIAGDATAKSNLKRLGVNP